MDQIEELLTRRVQQILPTREALEQKLRSGQKIRLYQGFDPSSPNLHIGHLVGLLQLKMFQDLGHEVIFLIGDFTGMIGDPTDKSATRPKLTHDQVMVNAKTYQEQAGRILRFEGDNAAKMMFNYDWLSKLTFADLIEVASNLTVQQMIERDMFQERLKANKPIHLHEFLYPLAQGYDSVAMDVDLEVGGNDQMFNLLVGRQLMKAIKGKEKFCLTTRLLTDNEGRKVGKTTGNAINLFGDANDLYGAVMSQPDSAIMPMYELATIVPLDEISPLRQEVEAQPMEVKKRLAFEVVKLCQGDEKARSAQAYFESTFQNRSDEEFAEVTIETNETEMTVLQLLTLVAMGESNGERKRAIAQGAVEINGNKITDPMQVIDHIDGVPIRYGKHQHVRVRVK